MNHPGVHQGSGADSHEAPSTELIREDALEEELEKNRKHERWFHERWVNKMAQIHRKGGSSRGRGGEEAEARAVVP
eukprot:4334467-Heterocapsa_arctica.AAC.1